MKSAMSGTRLRVHKDYVSLASHTYRPSPGRNGGRFFARQMTSRSVKESVWCLCFNAYPPPWPSCSPSVGVGVLVSFSVDEISEEEAPIIWRSRSICD